jgi:hypothetical protein
MSRDPRIPKLFWVQAVIDTIRVLAWWIVSFWGWHNNDYFSWITPVLFLIPTHYIWLIKGMRLRLREAGMLPDYISLTERAAGYRATAEAERSQKEADKRAAKAGYVAPEPSHDYVHPYDNPPSYDPYTPTPDIEVANPPVNPRANLSPREKRKLARIYFLAMFLGPLGFAMWMVALIDLIFQHYYPNGPTSKTVAYRVPAAVISNPYLLSPTLLDTCANWLSSANATTNIGHIGLLNNPSAQGTAGYTHLILWMAPTAVAGHAVIAMLIPMTARGKDYQKPPTEVNIHRYLRNMAVLVPLLLLFGAVLTSGIYGSKATSHQSVQLRYTNNATQTGGCDWAVVAPDYTFGAWDISVRLPLRIIMAVLGL